MMMRSVLVMVAGSRVTGRSLDGHRSLGDPSAGELSPPRLLAGRRTFSPAGLLRAGLSRVCHCRDGGSESGAHRPGGVALLDEGGHALLGLPRSETLGRQLG